MDFRSTWNPNWNSINLKESAKIITSVFPIPRFFGYRNHKNFRNLFRVFALLIRPKSFCDFDIDGIWIGKPFIIWNELRCEKGGIKGITSVLMQSFGVEFSICIN